MLIDEKRNRAIIHQKRADVILLDDANNRKVKAGFIFYLPLMMIYIQMIVCCLQEI
jgi:hypothetical protein